MSWSHYGVGVKTDSAVRLTGSESWLRRVYLGELSDPWFSL